MTNGKYNEILLKQMQMMSLLSMILAGTLEENSVLAGTFSDCGGLLIIYSYIAVQNKPRNVFKPAEAMLFKTH